MKTFIASATSNPTIQAAGAFEWANNILSSTQALLGSALVVIGLLVFIIAAWRTKNIPGIIGGLIAGGLIAGAGVLIVALSGVFQQTVQEGNTTAAPISIVQSNTSGNLS